MASQVFNEAKWIWTAQSCHEISEYADFVREFECDLPHRAVFRISSRSDYVFWLNGRFAGFNQYHDFPDAKVYDEYDVTNFLKKGKNRLAVRVLGKNYHTASHIADGKGVIYELEADTFRIFSDTDTLSRVAPDYVSGEMHYITRQLGKSFKYDFNNADDWINGGNGGFTRSVVTGGGRNFLPRPVERLKCRYLQAELLRENIYDLKGIKSGYLSFCIIAPKKCDLRISYGEHLIDGRVRRIIHDRDFSAEFILKPGRNEFISYFLRFGLRYLQLECEERLEVEHIGIMEAIYPLTVREYKECGIRKDIYDISIQTLRNCIHEHYEDSPWREQAQYSMDSRTQMLCGYYAFGEYRMPRAALKTMAHKLTESGYLPITSPSETQLSIPIYSFVYVLALEDYVRHSKDTSLICEVYGNVKTMLDAYIKEIRNGLIPMLKCWNFFEWSDGLHNGHQISDWQADENLFALPTNCFFIVALKSFVYLSEQIAMDAEKYKPLISEVSKAAHERFFDGNLHLYYTYSDKDKNYHLCEYTQVVALYAGLGGSYADEIIETITSDGLKGLQPMTLSSYIYKYEVLLRRGGYRDYIVRDVNKVWGRMADEGATTFWETIKGAEDFGGAGSLCHGWSAIPAMLCFALDESEREKI